VSPSDETLAHSAVTIRKAGAQDAQAIDRMVTALAGDIGAMEKKVSDADDLERALAASPPLVQGLIAEDATGPVGLCLWFPWFSSWRGSAGIYVQDLYVAPRARRAGLARRLLSATAAEARDIGARFIRLGVDRTNLPAIAFYDRLGFEPMESEKMVDLFGPSFDNLLATTRQVADNLQPDQSERP
jgi:ribosomal protein S18 acetylase RimI-like enzyme